MRWTPTCRGLASFYAISMRNAFERTDRLLAGPLPPGPLDPPPA